MSVSTFALFAIGAMATGCSFLVSTEGLSLGSDPDGGPAQSASSSGGQPASGLVLGDAGTVPVVGNGTDAASPTAVVGDAGVDSSSVPVGKPDGSSGGGGLDASGGTDSSSGADATPAPTACSLGHARVFVTSTMYDGKLGGVSGADADCLARAAAGGLGGKWRAWLSDSSFPAVAHVYMSAGGYVLVDGTTVVAPSYAALVSGSLAHAIDLTETGAPVTNGQTEVWTGIDVTGSMGNGGYCGGGSGDWSSNSSSAGTPLVGHLDATDATWSAAYLQVCNRTNVRLYCFESCP